METHRILEGIRVLDWTLFHLGPYAAALLADLGAEVIHVEEREHGDPMRGLTTLYGVNVTMPGGRQLSFEEHNRNKKGLALDLKREKGREILYKLVEKSDMFITNFRYQAVEKLGLDYESLRQLNPRLIYGLAWGLGPNGPDRNMPSLGPISLARSGFMMGAGTGEANNPPVVQSGGIGDRIASVFMVYGLIAALLARERWGIGQKVEVSQLGTNIIIQGQHVMPALFLGTEFPRPSRTNPGNPLDNCYKCKDDKWIMLCIIEQQRLWSVFCKAISLPELENDFRFDTPENRRENRLKLVSILEDVFVKKTVDEWCAIFRQAKDLPFAPVNTYLDLLSDEQVNANSYIVDWDHPTLGKLKFLGFPVEFSETPAELRLPAPEVGQHNEEILLNVLGFTWNDIELLRQEEVI